MDRKKSQYSRCWGLYKKDSTDAIPLKSLNISIKIIHNVARILYSQTYSNNTKFLLETEFFFPISPNACFDSFEATFNNTTIKGVIKEKEKAKEEYKEAVQQGRTAAYSEINEETGDIMKVQIGNIPQGTDIVVTYSYIEKLETALNKFWCFRLFSTLTPRYNGGNLRSFLNHNINLLSNYPTISTQNKNAYPWDIQVEIQSSSPITSLNSPSHDIVTTYGNEKHTCTITLNPQKKSFPHKDFVLLYSNDREGKPDYLLTPFEDGYCAMVSLLADFDEKISQNDAYENFVKAKEVDSAHTMSQVRGEYIFLIDRSGSMEGDRIAMARDSLCLFLTSLPKDSLFNVVSFGNNYSLLHPTSQVYSQQSLDSSVKLIKNFQADMGGTEIYEALKKVFSSTTPKKGYPRFIFLLTDGDVSNTNQVLDLISKNNHKARVFTIGIGNGCSPELITKGAINGRGKHEFVSDNKQIYEKVICLLNASLSPCYSDLSLHADNFDAVIKSVSPNPASVPFLINGQTVTFFLFLRKEAFQQQENTSTMNLKLQMYDSRVQKQRTVEITLDVSEAMENDLIPKLGIYDMIKRLEAQKSEIANNQDSDIFWMMKKDIKEAMLEYSLKYGILCKETAFFCEISSETAEHDVPQAKVIIPTTLSQDYSKEQNQFIQTSSYQNITYGTPPMMMYGAAAPTSSLTLCSAAPSQMMKKKSSGSNLLSGMAKGVSDDVDSLFTVSHAKKKMAAPVSRSRAQEKMKCAEEEDDLFSVDSEYNSKAQQSMPPSFSTSSLSVSSKETSSTSSSYLDVIMKLKFEGYWDPNDQQIKQRVLINGNLTSIPQEITVADDSLKDKVWITILVLLWLEVACKEDSKAWALVHQKGCEWLKGQGIDYEVVKNLGSSFIHTK